MTWIEIVTFTILWVIVYRNKTLLDTFKVLALKNFSRLLLIIKWNCQMVYKGLKYLLHLKFFVIKVFETTRNNIPVSNKLNLVANTRFLIFYICSCIPKEDYRIKEAVKKILIGKCFRFLLGSTIFCPRYFL